MTSGVTRWSFLLLTCIVLSGCALPLLNMSAAKETKLFALGLDQYIASGDLATLEQLPQQYPQGEWRTKAEIIIEMVALQRQQQGQLEQKGKDLADCQAPEDPTDCLAPEELANCQEDKKALAQDNLMLEETLKRLKDVLIDTELQAK